jgi:hypothetical protein
LSAFPRPSAASVSLRFHLREECPPVGSRDIFQRFPGVGRVTDALDTASAGVSSAARSLSRKQGGKLYPTAPTRVPFVIRSILASRT